MDYSDYKNNWDSADDLYNIGRVIFEDIPPAGRPAWAATVLKLCYCKVGPVNEIDALLAVAADPGKWGQGRECFDAIHELALGEDVSLFLAVLLLAEVAAKVTYNASVGPDAFDSDVGWRLIGRAKIVCNFAADPAFGDQVWQQITQIA